MRVTRKPSSTEAWTVQEICDTPITQLPEPILNALSRGSIMMGDVVQVQTKNGWVIARPDDYLILGNDGQELYPCSGEDFDCLYHVLDSDTPEA